MFFKNIPMFYGALTIILVGLVPCPAAGQVLTNKQLTEDHYSLWHTMTNEQLSEKAHWVSYCMSYKNNVDTTFLMHTTTLKKVSFPSVRAGQFKGERYFTVLKNGSLVLYDLVKDVPQEIPNVRSYDFSNDGQFLVTLDNDGTLVLRKNGIVVKSFADVSNYKWNQAMTHLFYATCKNDEGSVGFIFFDRSYNDQILLQATRKKFTDFTWQLNGKAVAFYSERDGVKTLYHYDLAREKLLVLVASQTDFPDGSQIGPNKNIKMKIARDGKKIFFGISSQVAKDGLNAGIEVWHAKDKILYRDRALLNTISSREYLAVWDLSEQTVRQISTVRQKWVALTGNEDYALLANPRQYEPIYKWIGDMDYYLMDLKTGKTELLLEAHSGYNEQLDFSPDGRYISYYKEDNWWVYDLRKKSHTSITQGLQVSWDTSLVDPGNELHVWGQPGWTMDGRYILCYDFTDIWAISPDGKERHRLTNGKQANVRYRLHKSALSTDHNFNYSHLSAATYNLSKDVVLSALHLETGSTGFYTLHPDRKLSLLVKEEALLSKYQKGAATTAFIYVRQRYDSSPSLFLHDGKQSKKLVQSNRQQQAYCWGKAEMIYYKDSKNNSLKGVLYYPANYDSSKQYPMIVHIYETLSGQLHHYINPSVYNGIGFNVTNLVTDGYFVLLPDIAYERGNTGQSALDCVTAAVKKVSTMGVVDPQKIGLYGQSFGGYEVNFIITQTHLFATAISGSAVSDIVQHYFTINTIYNTIDGWRYENQQYRMGFNFFDNQEAYFRNNPLNHASNITTPLLTWAGKLDENVPSKQAETFYAALRRLRKEHVMLVYENDEHVFINEKNQEDLTHKMNEWFGYYLKDKPRAKWMKADFEK